MGISQARVFRTTATAPNAGSVRDLAGNAAAGGPSHVATTIARFTGATGASTIAFNPGVATQAEIGIPTTDQPLSTGTYWRDAVVENVEPITYAAGTWALRLRVHKSGQGLVVSDLIIRVTAILYRQGVAAEMGRIVFPDNLLTGTQDSSGFVGVGSFSLPARSFAANERLIWAIYVQTISVAGTVAAPAAAVDVHLRTDAASTADGSYMSSIPNYSTQFVRSASEVQAGSTDSARRVVSMARQPSEFIATTDTAQRVSAYARLPAEVLAGVVDTARRVVAAARRPTEVLAAQVDVSARVAGYVRRPDEVMPDEVDSASRGSSFVRRPLEAMPTPTDVAIRAVTFPRESTTSVPAQVDSSSRLATFRRVIAESLVVTDTTTRLVIFPRSITESVALADSTSRVASFPRAISELVALADSTSRVYLANRVVNDVVVKPLDITTRLLVSRRTASDVVPVPLDAPIKLVTYGRTVRYQFQPGDEPLIDVTKSISGIVRTTEGAVYTAGALVVLYRSDTNVGVQTTTSAADGSYSFPRNSYDTAQYYVAAFITAPTPQQAVSERNLAAV